MKSDFTLRRYQNSDDVDSDAPSKLPRSYRLSELEFVANDAVPRFYLQMKTHSLGGPGEQVKLSAETDSERKQWIKAIMDLKALVPVEEEDDPYREWGGGGDGGAAGGVAGRSLAGRAARVAS